MTLPPLTHYAARRVTKQIPPHPHHDRFLKPLGLWVTVKGRDDDWPSWCLGNDVYVETLAFEHAVTLRPDANILHIDTHVGLAEFDRRFGMPPPWRDLLPDDFPDSPGHLSIRHLNWPEVMALYDGILIEPYQWWARLEMFWYYGWDCNSGCIWNPNIIESIDVQKAKL